MSEELAAYGERPAAAADPKYFIRHACTGLYLVMIGSSGDRQPRGADGPGLPAELLLMWRKRAAFSMTREKARQTAAFYIAMTGDHAVELEPVDEKAGGAG